MKNKEVHFRLDEELWLFLNSACEELGCTLSSYMRNRIFSPEYINVAIEYDKDIDVVMNRMGNNINQIARSLNTLQNIFQTQDIINEAEGIKEMIATAISLLKQNREIYEEFAKQKKETEKQLYRIIKKREIFEFLEIDEKEK